MTRFSIGWILLVLVWTSSVAAQSVTAPRLEVEFEENQAIPGQPLSLRLTILVPTWMTAPVEFPSFEAPNLMVRLNGRATAPVSGRVGNETWSGITRRYTLTPMVPQGYSLSPRDLVVTWSDPETRQPRQDIVKTPTLEFTGILPQGAEGMNPFLAATSLEMTQQLEGSAAPLAPGDSVTRSVTVAITGASPIFLPLFSPQEAVQGVAIYPSEPVLAESEANGVLSGTRTEVVSYLAQTGGTGTAARISLDWYNLETGTIETASVDAVDLTVDAPIAEEAPNIDPQTVVRIAVMISAVLGIGLAFRKWITPRWTQLSQIRKARYLASEAWAYSDLTSAIARRDFGHVLSALEVWQKRLPALDPDAARRIADASGALGASLYGRGELSEVNPWQDLLVTVRTIRGSARQRPPETYRLPPLNP